MGSLQLKSFQILFDTLSKEDQELFLLHNAVSLEKFLWSVEIEGVRDLRYFFARSPSEVRIMLSRDAWLRKILTDYYSVEGGIRMTNGSGGCRVCGK